ncbi:hypothetical protein Q9189_008062 [Teloschistes chrysophthalmus]
MQEQKLSQDDAKYFTQQQLQGFLEGKFGKGLNYKIRVRASSLHALPVVHTIDKEQNVQYRTRSSKRHRHFRAFWLFTTGIDSGLKSSRNPNDRQLSGVYQEDENVSAG